MSGKLYSGSNAASCLRFDPPQRIDIKFFEKETLEKLQPPNTKAAQKVPSYNILAPKSTNSFESIEPVTAAGTPCNMGCDLPRGKKTFFKSTEKKVRVPGKRRCQSIENLCMFDQLLPPFATDIPLTTDKMFDPCCSSPRVSDFDEISVDVSCSSSPKDSLFDEVPLKAKTVFKIDENNLGDQRIFRASVSTLNNIEVKSRTGSVVSLSRSPSVASVAIKSNFGNPKANDTKRESILKSKEKTLKRPPQFPIKRKKKTFVPSKPTGPTISHSRSNMLIKRFASPINYTPSLRENRSKFCRFPYGGFRLGKNQINVENIYPKLTRFPGIFDAKRWSLEYNRPPEPPSHSNVKITPKVRGKKLENIFIGKPEAKNTVSFSKHFLNKESLNSLELRIKNRK